VGPLLTSAGYTYCLTAVDRFTRWPEAIPIWDITADTVALTFLTGWISPFDCPQTITTDQGHQFESQLFRSLAKLCGILLSWTIAHHLADNRLVKRFHRTLKEAIMFHADQRWTEALPLVILGIRTSFKADLQASVAQLVYGELLTHTADPVEPAHLITQLRQRMARLRPVSTAHHASPATLVHKDLHACLYPSGRNTPSSGAPIQRPISGPVLEIENVTTPWARQGSDCANRQGQVGHNPSTIDHTATSSYPNYTFRSPRPLPRTLQYLSNNLSWKSYIPSKTLKNNRHVLGNIQIPHTTGTRSRPTILVSNV
jgi:transposase InsO family protein